MKTAIKIASYLLGGSAIIVFIILAIKLPAPYSKETRIKAAKQTFSIIEIDSCEYIMIGAFGMHKGNCKNH